MKVFEIVSSVKNLSHLYGFEFVPDSLFGRAVWIFLYDLDVTLQQLPLLFSQTQQHAAGSDSLLSGSWHFKYGLVQ